MSDKVRELMDAIARHLSEDDWGTIEPEDFEEDGEYSEELQEVFALAMKEVGLI